MRVRAREGTCVFMVVCVCVLKNIVCEKLSLTAELRVLVGLGKMRETCSFHPVMILSCLNSFVVPSYDETTPKVHEY